MDIFNPIPANASIAAALTRRYASALECISAGYRFVAAEGCAPGQVFVSVFKPGAAKWDSSYTIVKGFANMEDGCDCPDFQKWGKSFPCKHCLAYAEILNQDAASEAFLAQLDEMYGNAECISTGCDPFAEF